MNKNFIITPLFNKKKSNKNIKTNKNVQSKKLNNIDNYNKLTVSPESIGIDLDKNIDIIIDNNNKKSNSILSSKLYMSLNRLLHSKKCFYYYIIMMIFSVILFIYSIIAINNNLNENFIMVCESFIVVLIIIDITLKYISEGREYYFSKFTNIFDIIIVILNLISIFLYFEFHSLSAKLEEISVLLLIIIRNSIQLLRVFVFYKNHKYVKVSLKCNKLILLIN